VVFSPGFWSQFNLHGYWRDMAVSLGCVRATGYPDFDSHGSSLINFGERYRQGETISTAFVESTLNQVGSWRLWAPASPNADRGAEQRTLGCLSGMVPVVPRSSSSCVTPRDAAALQAHSLAYSTRVDAGSMCLTPCAESLWGRSMWCGELEYRLRSEQRTLARPERRKMFRNPRQSRRKSSWRATG
jgi:hypothetical protein